MNKLMRRIIYYNIEIDIGHNIKATNIYFLFHWHCPHTWSRHMVLTVVKVGLEQAAVVDDDKTVASASGASPSLSSDCSSSSLNIRASSERRVFRHHCSWLSCLLVMMLLWVSVCLWWESQIWQNLPRSCGGTIRIVRGCRWWPFCSPCWLVTATRTRSWTPSFVV